jgi:DNA-binding CsgD family transcriptional regulator
MTKRSNRPPVAASPGVQKPEASEAVPGWQPTRAELARRFGLSRAEAAVAHLLLQGLKYREAATRLGVSLHTVHSHVKAVHRKAGVSTTLQFVTLFYGGRSP